MKSQNSILKTGAVLLALTVVASLATTPTLMAAPIQPGIEFSGTGPTNGWDGTMGYEFTAQSSNVAVTSLGMFTDGGVVPGPIEVGLWDSGGNLLAHTFVLPTDPVQGHFQYNSSFPPVPLIAGQDYVVGAQSGLYTFDPSGFTVDPRIAYVEDRWNEFGTAFAEPTISEFGSSGETGFFGGNVGLGVLAPEPATLLLMGSGLIGAAVYGWRRRQQRLAV